MADQNNDEYKATSFYKTHSQAKTAGFSKFDANGEYFFCRFVDGEIALISQGYKSAAGRDNGITSVKKNEKLKARYTFETRGTGQFGFSLKAGNSQEIAISPDFATAGRAGHIAGRLNGSIKSGAVKSQPKTKAKPKTTQTKAVKATKTEATYATNGRTDDYKDLAFYKKHGGKTADGFDSFSEGGEHYFSLRQSGDIVLISEAYTSQRGRDNGIASVKKNMPLEARYVHSRHKNGKHYFDLKAGNHQEIATSRWYSSEKAALGGAAILRGEKKAATKVMAKPKKKTPAKKAPKKAVAGAAIAAVAGGAAIAARAGNVEQNYKPLAFYKKHTKTRKAGSKDGIEKFKGEDGQYYFAYYENDDIVLISEGYPTQSAQETGAASVLKNLPIEGRYKYRGRLKKSGKYDFTLKAGNHKEIARSRWYGSAAAAATGAAYLMGTRKRSKKAAPIAAAGLAGVAGAAALAATPTPKPKPKPVATKPEAPKPETAKPAAPIIAAAGVAAAAAATAAAVTPTPAPKAAAAQPVVAAAKPITAAPVTAATTAATGGGGIWGWLKWLLLGLLALFAFLFLFKSCSKTDAAKTPVATTTTAAAVATPAIPEPEATPEPTPAPEPTPVPAVPEPAPAPEPVQVPTPAPTPPPAAAVTPISSGLTCACGTSSSLLFNIPVETPKNVSYLGSNPQFGDSHALTPSEFHQKLKTRYNSSAYDASYLDYTFKALGYAGGFSEVDASAFGNDTLPKGAEGILGFGQRHALQYSKLNVSARDLKAFRVSSLNGCDVHFMKTCGNYMYACNP